MIIADESEDGSDVAEPSGDKDEGEDIFMQSYSDILNEELKSSTLKKSFVRANEQSNHGNQVIFSSFFLPIDYVNICCSTALFFWLKRKKIVDVPCSC